jgi:hypothetical protein
VTGEALEVDNHRLGLRAVHALEQSLLRVAVRARQDRVCAARAVADTTSPVG